jgi:hypothetical protein
VGPRCDPRHLRRRNQFRERVEGALAATLRELDAVVGVGVGRGHVVGARGCRGGGERGNVGA